MTTLADSWQRQINYLRVSVTDRCNLRCVYCSAEAFEQLPHAEILSYEEITRLIEAATGLGISKVRLTGGEPLLRPRVSALVRMVAQTPGIDDLSLTTNGTQLDRFAAELKAAGLDRVNISLDTLRPDRFKRITGGDKLETVLAGIEAARRLGLNPVKINMVVMRGVNDDEVVDFARKTVHEGWNVRFIEFMPFGSADTDYGTVPSAEIRERIGAALGPLLPHVSKTGNGPARYFRLRGAAGTVGFISAITEHFCATCNRLRVTADGHLRPCLLDDDEVDVKAALRRGAGPDELREIIQQAVAGKREHHHLSQGVAAPERSMRQIGG